jgi:hypothetical protein
LGHHAFLIHSLTALSLDDGEKRAGTALLPTNPPFPRRSIIFPRPILRRDRGGGASIRDDVLIRTSYVIIFIDTRLPRLSPTCLSLYPFVSPKPVHMALRLKSIGNRRGRRVKIFNQTYILSRSIDDIKAFPALLRS